LLFFALARDGKGGWELSWRPQGGNQPPIELAIAVALLCWAQANRRQLAPIMPWKAFANVAKREASAIAVNLKEPGAREQQGAGSLPSDKPTSFIMKVVPPEK
jgi:hypothetical protein